LLTAYRKPRCQEQARHKPSRFRRYSEPKIITTLEDKRNDLIAHCALVLWLEKGAGTVISGLPQLSDVQHGSLENALRKTYCYAGEP